MWEGLDENPAMVCGRGWMKILQWYVGGLDEDPAMVCGRGWMKVLQRHVGGA